jgi:hypothetical protein
LLFKQNPEVRDEGILRQLLTFCTLSLALFFYLEKRFGDWYLPPSSGIMHTQLGPVDRASPYLRTPEPTHDRKYKQKDNMNHQRELRQTLKNSTYMRPCTYGHASFNGQSVCNRSSITTEANSKETNCKTRKYQF